MNKQKNTPKIAIIGAGASGLALLVFLTQYNIKATLFEKNNKIGKKLLATGNGKCNITNKNISLKNYHTNYKNLKEIQKILNRFDFYSCKKFFTNLGIEFIYKEQKAYPMSNASSSIVDAFIFQAMQSNSPILTHTLIESIEYQNSSFIINGTQKFDIVILASGSKAMKKLGGTDSGYLLAQNFSHTIIPPQPSLVQLITKNKNLELISGIKLTGTIQNHTGDILFTKYGLSGSAVLDISREVAIQLQTHSNIPITIDIAPSFSKEQLKTLLKERIKILPNQKINLWLDGIFHKKLSTYLMQEAKLPTHIQYVKQITTKEIHKIVHLIKNLPFVITDTKGFDFCEVCSGGVDLSEINLNTMESKKQKNLYIIGELLDIDGDCGGYNLHFAWASAFIAAQAIKTKTL